MLASPHTPQFRAGRSAGVVLAIAAVIAGTVYFGRVIRGPLTASQLDTIASPSVSAAPQETVYAEPVVADWPGIIEGILAGGRGFVVRRTDTGERVQAYLPSGTTSSLSEGPVRVTGRITGISCAYADSVFDGQCTPTVDIVTIEPLPLMLIQ